MFLKVFILKIYNPPNITEHAPTSSNIKVEGIKVTMINVPIIVLFLLILLTAPNVLKAIITHSTKVVNQVCPIYSDKNINVKIIKDAPIPNKTSINLPFREVLLLLFPLKLFG